MECQGITRQTKRRGFNLIEAAIVLGVVGAVIGTIWVTAAAMMESYKVNKTVDGMLIIAKEIQQRISYQNAEAIGGGRFTDSMASAGLIPKDWLESGVPRNPFGGIVSLGNVTESDNIRFSITIKSIPKAGCIKIIMRMSSLSNAQGKSLVTTYFPRYIHINQGTPEYASFSITTFPISAQDAENACIFSNMIGFAFNYTRIN